MDKWMKSALVAMLLLVAMAVQAQDTYNWNSANYPTLQAAEEAMRAYNQANGGDDLYRCGVDDQSSPGTINYQYCVDRQAAYATGAGGYRVDIYGFSCATNATLFPGEDLTNACVGADEAYVLNKFEEWFTTQSPWAGYCNLEVQVVGEYADPFRYWGDAEPYYSNGVHQYNFIRRYSDSATNRRSLVFKWRVRDGNGQCSSTESQNTVAISKRYGYRCPSGYQLQSMTSVGAESWPFICKAFPSNLVISTQGRAANTCDTTRTDHPCVPATGEKLLFEDDFVWAGHSFGRTYRSRSQAYAFSQMGFNWSHSWSSNVTPPPTLSQPAMMANQNNNREEYKPVSGMTSTYRATSDRRQLLRKLPDNTWMQYGSNGVQKIFNAYGRLERIENKQSPESNLIFTYDGQGRMTTVTDGIGRSLGLEYEENIYINPANSLPLIIPGSNAVASYGGTGGGGAGAGAVPGRTFLPTAFRLKVIRDMSGVALVTYTYDAAGRLTSALYADGKHRDYHYGETAHVCVGATSGCTPSNFAYYLTGVTAEDGNRLSDYYYDAYGRVTQSVHAGGAYDTTLTYVAASQTQSKTDVTRAGLGTTTYSFEPKGSTASYRRPTSAVSSDGTESWQYDYYGAWKSYTNKRGITYYTEYNTAGRETKFTEAQGYAEQRSTVTNWSTDLLTKTSLEVRNYANQALRRIDYTYNTRAQVLTATLKDVVANTTRSQGFTYCEQADIDTGACPVLGLLIAVDGPRTDVSDTTAYVYYQADHSSCASDPAGCPYRKGNLWKITNALGQTVEYLKYDIKGNVLSVKDANGVITDLQYDQRGRLTASLARGLNGASETDDRAVHLEYWPGGEIKKITLGDGSYTSYAYDAAHRLTGIADAAGNTITYALDSAGNRTSETVRDASDALVRTLSTTYNAVGRLQSITDAYSHSASLTYDASGNPDLATDGLNRVEDQNYDPLERITRSLRDVSGVAAETKYTYSLFDDVTKVTDPKGLNTTYAYNGFGDLTQVASPDTGTANYTYDNSGNLATKTDARGVTTTYGYDALNRMTSISYPTASLDVAYTYDTAQAACQSGETFTTGRVAKMVDGSGSTVYCYNRFGDLVRKVQTTNGNAFVLQYAWNAAGQLLSKTYPDGAVIDYVYDTIGRVTEIGATPTGSTRQVLLKNLSYHPFGPASAWQYGNNRTLSRTLNLNYQPGVVQDEEAGGISVGYEFDAVGNLKWLRDGDQSEPPQREYGYDGLNRLTQTKDGATATVLQAYGYDKTGNRTSATVSGTTTTYTYPADKHRLSQVGTNARAYDANGNTTQIVGAPTRDFVYGDHNRMTQALQSGSVASNYAYNGAGEQVRRFLGAVNTYAVYDETGQWIGDYGNGGASAPMQQAIWFGGMPVGVLVGAGASQKLYYVESDALGTPRVVIDPTRGTTGTTVWKWDLAGEAFGTTAPNQDPDGDSTQFVFNLRFPGQRYDAASGLNYNYFRDYEAATGRYVESDPIGLRGGVSTYGYVDAMPMQFIDPIGLFSVYRTPGTSSYSDVMPVGPCEQAVFSGDYLISWAACGGQSLTSTGETSNQQHAYEQADSSCFLKCAQEVLGVQDLMSLALVAAGQPIPGTKRFRTPGSSRGTSVAGMVADVVFGRARFPRGIRAPTIVGGIGTGTALRIAGTRSISRFAGRAVPVIGWGLLGIDAIKFGNCMKKCMEDGTCK